MAKPSSSKKVAKAARAGSGGRPGERRDLGFPMALVAVIAIGIAMVVWARATRDATAAPRVGEDHWHSAYDIYVCDTFLDPILDETDPNGIHTHADGLIHIHPFNSEASGSDATLSDFFASYGGQIDDESFTLDTGETFTEGEDCNGEPTVLQVARFDADNRDVDPQEYMSDLGGIRFDKTREAFTIALVPEGTDLPEPRDERYAQLDRVNPSVIDREGTVTGATTTVAPDGETTTAGDDDATADTTTTAAP